MRCFLKPSKGETNFIGLELKPLNINTHLNENDILYLQFYESPCVLDASSQESELFLHKETIKVLVRVLSFGNGDYTKVLYFDNIEDYKKIRKNYS